MGITELRQDALHLTPVAAHDELRAAEAFHVSASELSQELVDVAVVLVEAVVIGVHHLALALLRVYLSELLLERGLIPRTFSVP